MRSIALLLLIASSYIVHAQKTNNAHRKLCITPKGNVFGKIASAEIGKDGGRIESADGKVELIFPQGALEKNTIISIQPESNTMPAGRGTGYRLEPSGTVFKKPVKVIMHQSDEELKNIQRPLVSLALQDHRGQWRTVSDVKLDSVNKIMTGMIKHFSSLVVYDKALLIPRDKTVKVNTTANFLIYMFETISDIEDTEIWEFEYRMVMYDMGYFETKDPPLWRVNGKKNGDAVHGTVAPGIGEAVYTAPAQVPQSNPVTITVEMEMQWIKHPWKVVLPSEIYIVDGGYRFTFIGISQGPGGVFQMIDSSSCQIVIEKDNARLEHIVNYVPWSDWPQKTKSGCSLTYTNKEGYKGLVEITGISSASVGAASETNPFTYVNISLLPAMGNTPGMIEKCPKSPARESPSFPLPAQPKYIKFQTDGTDIYIEYMGMKGKNELKYLKNGEGFTIRIKRY